MIVEALRRSNGDDDCKWHVDRITADDPLPTVFGNLKTLLGSPYVDLGPALVRCIPLTLLALGSVRLGAKQTLNIHLYASSYSPRWFKPHLVDHPGYVQAHHGWLFHGPRTRHGNTMLVVSSLSFGRGGTLLRHRLKTDPGQAAVREKKGRKS